MDPDFEITLCTVYHALTTEQVGPRLAGATTADE